MLSFGIMMFILAAICLVAGFFARIFLVIAVVALLIGLFTG